MNNLFFTNTGMSLNEILSFCTVTGYAITAKRMAMSKLNTPATSMTSV